MKLAKQKGPRVHRVPEAIQDRWDNEMCVAATLPLDHVDNVRRDMVRRWPQMREVFKTLHGIDIDPSVIDGDAKRWRSR